jgi:hypothetical protein
MTRVRFDPTTPVFEGAETVHALVSAAAVIGIVLSNEEQFSWNVISNAWTSHLRFTDITHGIAERTSRGRFPANVRCGLSADLLTGPFAWNNV